MQVGVLRLWIVGIKVGKTHVGNLSPLAGASLDIAVVGMIERMLLDAVEQLDRLVESLLVVGGACIFRQSVDGEAYCIELLLGVDGIAICIQLPEDSAILLVDEV